MIDRRDTCLAAIASALGLVTFARGASSQEIPTDSKALLNSMTGKLEMIAATDAVRIVYGNLVFAQLNYRIAINLKGYENTDEFRAPAYATADQVLFDEKSRLLLNDGAKPPDDLIGQMIDAYAKQREEYVAMVERMFKEGEGLLIGLTPTILVESMAYFAVASAAIYQSIGDWFTKSYVFPFCVRSG